MSVVLAVDIGTTKICALALDTESGNPLATLSALNDSEVHGLQPERHEQDPRRILELSYRLLHELLAQEALRGRSVRAIGLTGQMHGVLLVDARLNPLTNLITWQDKRCAGEIPAWQERLGEHAPKRLGCRLAAGYGGASLAWLQRLGLVPVGARAMSIAGYLAAALNGQVSCDPSHAASWGLYAPLQASWDGEALELLGIPGRLLPEICPSGHPLGPLTALAREALGLGAGILVCSPLGDNQASVYGLAGGDTGALVLNLGTGGQVSLPCQAYVYHPSLETRPMPFSGYIQVGASLCAGWSYAYLRRFFQAVLREFAGLEMPDEAVYTRMNELAGQTPDNLPIFDTRFSGSRLEPGLRGALSGIDAYNLTPAALSRAMAEGIVEELYQLAQLGQLQGIRRVVAAGNAARKNPLLPELIAQRFGIPCEVSPHREEAALGAARAAALGVQTQ